MKFFQKTSGALLITVLIILAATQLSVSVKLGGKIREITDSFYDAKVELSQSVITQPGTEATGVSYRSISSHLKNICAYADGIATIADNYGIDIEDLRWDSDSLKNAMAYSREDISYIYYCYSELLSSLDQMEARLYRTDLNERDASGFQQYKSNIDGAKAAIETAADSYNSAVREFLRRYDQFPADMLADLCDLDMPEYFGY